MTSKRLVLLLSAPLQSWGVEGDFERRRTNRQPTLSGVVGLLSAALGKKKGDVSWANDIDMTVRVDQRGTEVVDFQTATDDWGVNRGTTKTIASHYISDGAFIVVLDGPEAVIDTCAEALDDPVFPLYLGRKSCPPGVPVKVGVSSVDTNAIIEGLPLYRPQARVTDQPQSVPVYTTAREGAPDFTVRDNPLGSTRDEAGRDKGLYSSRPIETSLISYLIKPNDIHPLLVLQQVLRDM